MKMARVNAVWLQRPWARVRRSMVGSPTARAVASADARKLMRVARRKSCVRRDLIAPLNAAVSTVAERHSFIARRGIIALSFARAPILVGSIRFNAVTMVPAPSAAGPPTELVPRRLSFAAIIHAPPHVVGEQSLLSCRMHRVMQRDADESIRAKIRIRSWETTAAKSPTSVFQVERRRDGCCRVRS